MKNTKGLTFVEFLVAFTIVGILIVATRTIMEINEQKARDAQRIADMEALSQGVEKYFFDTGEVPNSIPDDLVKEVDLERKLENLYVIEVPDDPLPVANSYRYVYLLKVNYGALPTHIYEFNAQLEAPANDFRETDDNGNVAEIYEVGTGASTLGAGQTVGVAVDTTCTSIQWENTQPGSGGCAGTPSGLNCGTAVPPCNGLTANVCVIDGIIVGGPDDGQPYTGILNGGNFDQVIVGTKGNDILNGGNAKDTMCGMGGNDFLYGQNGQDFLDGGDGFDVADAGNGPNTCINSEVETSC